MDFHFSLIITNEGESTLCKMYAYETSAKTCLLGNLRNLIQDPTQAKSPNFQPSDLSIFSSGLSYRMGEIVGDPPDTREMKGLLNWFCTSGSKKDNSQGILRGKKEHCCKDS